MKKIRYHLMSLAATAALLLSCVQPLESPPESPVSPGTGRVVLSASTGSGGSAAESSRTVLPTETPEFNRYALVFSREAFGDFYIDDAGDLAGSGLSQELEAGTWTVTATAYRLFTVDGWETEYPAAQGTETLTVEEGYTYSLTVYLAPLPIENAGEEVKGIFTYKVSFPDNVSGELVLGDEPPIPVVSGDEVSLEKTPGYYPLGIYLNDGSLSAGVSEFVHIYAGLESKAEFTFTEEDFANTLYLAGTLNLPDETYWETITGGTITVYIDEDYTVQIGEAISIPIAASWIIGLPASYSRTTLYLKADLTGIDGVYSGKTSARVSDAGARDIIIDMESLEENPVPGNPIIGDIAEVAGFIEASAGGESAEYPVFLPVGINLADVYGGWLELLSIIDAQGKYIALDLSDSTMGGATEFDPDISVSTGKDKIVALLLPDGATSIMGQPVDSPIATFQYFTGLKSAGGRNVTDIGNYAFYECYALETVDFPEATTIGERAFSFSYTLETAYFPELTAIGIYAFWNCKSLETVYFPKVTTIDYGTFWDCPVLEAATFPEATSIGDYAFSGCEALEMAYFPETITIGGNAFNGCTVLETLYFPKVTEIGEYAFNECIALTTADFPEATSIGDYAFLGCTTLETVFFPETIYIGAYAFYACVTMTTIDFPKVASISNDAFSYCSALETAYFPEVTTIGDFAFSYTGSTTLTVYLGNTAPVLGVNLFYSSAYDSKLVTVRVPSSATGYDLPFDYSDTYTYNWGNAFRGIGWDGESYLDGEVNLYITLYVDVEESNESLTP